MRIRQEFSHSPFFAAIRQGKPSFAARIRQASGEEGPIMILTQSGQPSRGIHMVVRTLKQKAYAGTSRAESGENRRREKEQGLSRQVGMMALWALVGLVVSRASIYGGMAPFGVGVAAAMNGPGAAVVYLAAVVGYLLPGGALLPIRYVAAVLAVGRDQMVPVPGWKAITRHGIFAPLMAFLGHRLAPAGHGPGGGTQRVRYPDCGGGEPGGGEASPILPPWRCR